MKELSDRQRRILECIKAYQPSYDYPPTRLELAHEAGFGEASSIARHLASPAKAGWIQMQPNTKRGGFPPSSDGGPSEASRGRKLLRPAGASSCDPCTAAGACSVTLIYGSAVVMQLAERKAQPDVLQVGACSSAPRLHQLNEDAAIAEGHS